jgi:hypothetical protein
MPMIEDTFRSHARSLVSPPECGAMVVPDDTAPLGHVSRALFVGEAGTLAVRLQDGTDLVFANLPPGALLPIRVSHVLATGSTAAGIVALW